MKKLSYLIIIVLISSLVLTGCSLLSNISQVPATEQSGVTYLTKGGPETIILYAGQDILVGTVTVSDDGINLYVEYLTTGDWEMTKTHLYVGKTDPTLLTSAPGQFPYSEPLNTPTSHTYTIPIADIDSYSLIKGKKWVASSEDLGVVPGAQIYIAAHAEVEKIVEPAPRYPSVVVSFDQGLRKDGSAVTGRRSNPLQGLVYEANNIETDFFSLGFGGWIIVEFDCPIPNGEGDDLRIIEDTWGSNYPLETAEVFASQDGIIWVPLGEANNTLRETGDYYHSFSAFDLDTLEWAKYIKVLDTTDPSLFNSRPTADGFDLNAVEALQDCVQEETAWGEGCPIRPDKNWATYFTYNIALAIGDSYGGGIVAYIFRMGDPGYDEFVQHGLIAATGDQSDRARWGCYGTSISGADGTAVGTGEQNTIDIEAGCTTLGTAADICANLSLDGYSDWFLPSIDELNLMYENLKVSGVGGFADRYYWSSSESSALLACYQDFDDGSQGTNSKCNTGRVRAVRAF